MSKVDIKDNSKSVMSAYDKARERSLEMIGLTAEGYAKRDCPVKTGRARNSITHAVQERAVYIGSNVIYFPAIEFGTIQMQARPVLRDAATQHTSTYNQIITDEFAKIK